MNSCRQMSFDYVLAGQLSAHNLLGYTADGTSRCEHLGYKRNPPVCYSLHGNASAVFILTLSVFQCFSPFLNLIKVSVEEPGLTMSVGIQRDSQP